MLEQRVTYISTVAEVVLEQRVTYISTVTEVVLEQTYISTVTEVQHAHSRTVVRVSRRIKIMHV